MSPELESTHYPNPEWERIADCYESHPFDALDNATLDLPLGHIVDQVLHDIAWSPPCVHPEGIETEGFLRLGDRGMENLMILSNLAWEGKLPHATYAFMFTMCGWVGDDRSPDWIPPIPRLQMPQLAAYPYDNKLPAIDGSQECFHYGLPNHTCSRQHAYSFLLHPACYEQMCPQTDEEIDWLTRVEYPI